MAEKKQNLDEQIKKLDEQVQWFYSDEFKLEEATKRYKQAVDLAKEIEDNLKKMQNEIEVLAKDFGKK